MEYDFYNVYCSSDFQCPDSGIPVQLVYDEEHHIITAQICTFVYPLNKEDNEFYDEDLTKATKDWCKRFRKYVKDLNEANDIAEKYDCWF